MIKSSVENLIVSIPYSSGLGLELLITIMSPIFFGIGLNPLFIRSRFGTITTVTSVQLFIRVSIPYSSGLGLELQNGVMFVHKTDVTSQSLIHQV